METPETGTAENGPATVCPACGRDTYTREGATVWIKGGSYLKTLKDGATGEPRLNLLRCGFCGWEHPHPPVTFLAPQGQ